MALATKPTALKALEGFPGHHEINKDEPKLTACAPQPAPAFLSDEAKLKWAELFPILRNCGILTVGDLELFARYCDLSSQFMEARKQLRTEGLMFTSANGNLLPNPAFSAYKALADALLKIEIQLGMTPAARTKVQAVPVEDKVKDDFDD